MKTRWAPCAPLALILLLAFGFGCRAEGPKGPPQAPPVPVTATLARSNDIPITLTAVGNVEPFETVTIKTMVNGQLTGVHFQEGQEVPKGAVLFTIDPRPYQAALRQAEGTLARDRAQLTNARTDEKRYAELVAKDFVTREQYDNMTTNVAALEATVSADEAAVENARINLSYCTITSPISGRIGKLLVREGNIVKSNDTVLVTINQVRPVRVSFAVPDAQLAAIRQRSATGKLPVFARIPTNRLTDGNGNGSGNHGAATLGAGDSEGELEFVDNTVDRSTGTIQLRGKFANEDGRLWPGQFVDVQLVLDRRIGATVIPTDALQTGQQGTFIFVIKADQTVEMRPVKAGPVYGGETVIEDGLASGEQVVTDGQLRCIPGSKVEIKNGGGRS